jgi:hypothetical protein
MAETDTENAVDKVARLATALDLLKDRFTQLEFRTKSSFDSVDARLNPLSKRYIDFEADMTARIGQLEPAVREISQAYTAVAKRAEATAAIDAKLRTDFAKDIGMVREISRTETNVAIADVHVFVRNSLADLRSELKLEIDNAMQELVSQGGFFGRVSRAVRAAWQELR